MNPPVADPKPNKISRVGRRTWLASRRNQTLAAVGAIVVGGLIATGAWAVGLFGRSSAVESTKTASEAAPKARKPGRPALDEGAVVLRREQQEAIGLRLATVADGHGYEVLSAPGRVGPNENQYAFITPRAAGVVRSVTAHIGQDVKAGDLLATIDSPEVGQARLDLYTRLQERDIAHAQADWQEKVYASTMELLDRIRKGETPEKIHTALAERSVGETRERLMTAYAQYRLAVATIARNRDLFAQKLITEKQHQKVTAEYEVAQSAYQSLMDQTGYESRLEYTRAHQALKQADASVRAAQERLRILGVKPDGTEPKVEGGKVVEVASDGTIASQGQAEGKPAAPANPESILPGEESSAVEPVGAHPNVTRPKDTPVSTYSIWAPFDGTVLDREMIVPGVAVDTTHRIFTLANMETVWVEASVPESDFDKLARSQGGKVLFRSPAYPGRTFEGRVIYSGDLVEEKSRTIKLLAEANNSERLLKPGMFVDVEVMSRRVTPAARIPASALLIQGSRSFVYVKAGPDRFEPREVVADEPQGDTAIILSGLAPGEEVVAEGASKLRAIASQTAGAGA